MRGPICVAQTIDHDLRAVSLRPCHLFHLPDYPFTAAARPSFSSVTLSALPSGSASAALRAVASAAAALA